MWKVLLLIGVVFLSNNTYAFKWSKCKKVYRKKHSADAKGGFAGVTATLTSNTSTDSSSSTSSFVSSTGDCAAIGLNKVDRPKLFFVENFEQIRIDAAIASGEHLYTFASMIGCNDVGARDLVISLKENYSDVFKTKEIKVVYRNIENMISKSAGPKNKCQIL